MALRLRQALLIALAVAATASQGCGGDEDPANVPVSPSAEEPTVDSSTTAAGPAPSASSPEATIEALIAAARERDGATACALVTRRGRALIDSPSIRGAGNKACVENVETYRDDEIDVALVSTKLVSKTKRSASVDLVLRHDRKRHEETIELLKVDGRWLANDPGAK